MKRAGRRKPPHPSIFNRKGMRMVDLKKAIDAAIEAEYAVLTARHALALAFCEMVQPDEVANEIAAERAARQRVIKLERLRDYYSGKGM